MYITTLGIDLAKNVFQLYEGVSLNTRRAEQNTAHISPTGPSQALEFRDAAGAQSLAGFR